MALPQAAARSASARVRHQWQGMWEFFSELGLLLGQTVRFGSPAPKPKVSTSIVLATAAAAS